METLLHEDKLIKDNERLRKENETYKTLTIVFENELKNTIRKNGLTPQKNQVRNKRLTPSLSSALKLVAASYMCCHKTSSTLSPQSIRSMLTVPGYR